MLQAYDVPAGERRKVEWLYAHSGVDTRYSVIPDYSPGVHQNPFYPATPDLEPFPHLEARMQWYDRHAPLLAVQALKDCIGDRSQDEITHLVTVSCTGASAPGLDIEIVRRMGWRRDIFRTSVNFMGCYGALHALRIADAICRADPGSLVAIVCTELCTLHFQKRYCPELLTPAMIFADGSAAVLVAGDGAAASGVSLRRFYSQMDFRGETDMAWNLSEEGFKMTLTGRVPRLIGSAVRELAENALSRAGLRISDVTDWAIHPGGKRILDTVSRALDLDDTALRHGYAVLRKYGNMSSPTLLFVLKEMLNEAGGTHPRILFASAFGPGLTLETLILET